MRSIKNFLIPICLAIFGAHALTYLLVEILPNAAITRLGIEGARQEVLSAFNETYEKRSYIEVLIDISRLDLGRSLDGVSVTQELKYALSSSIPRIIAAFLFVLLTFIGAALSPPKHSFSRVLQAFFSFFIFLPPYILPFLGLLVLLSLTLVFGIDFRKSTYHAVAIFVLALPSAALIFVQTRKISLKIHNSDFARTILAIGATPYQQRRQLIHNAIAEVAPSMEKVFVGLISILLFVEPLFGLSGFGTTAIRAITRSDTNLILGITLILGLSVGFFRIAAVLVRKFYRMDI